ncbi:MAG TPA: sigma-70 family RNA polymerase sigma factor [Candidatus Dormibacteraeota bacterium]|jgi:RNA polymerase sigma-70 factor (ECF subfamily)|nr:sigma-70 family RNA polymerase sigma factor [Candidatus Dormibacteraeota bacterium]
MTSAGVALIDGDLVTRSQAGDQDAIGELAAQVRPMVQRYASRFFSDPARAEDLAQTALMKAFSRVGDVRSPGAFQAWLLRIARNECLNELARQKHAQLPLSTLADGGAEIEAPAGGDDDPEEALLRSQLQALVRRVAATLPQHYRQALTMRALEDRTYEEISEALDIPVPVARLWYCRARKRFRSAFVTMMVARRNVPQVCQEMGEAIAELIEGTLPTGDRPRVQEHLGGCHVCRQTEDELRNTAFRAPARGFIIGLGLLRLGWHLPQRIRENLGHAPHAVGKFAVTGVGGVAVATAMVAGSSVMPAPAHANGTAPSAHGRLLMISPQGRTSEVELASDSVRTATVAGAPQAIAGLPDLTGMDTLSLVIQRLDEISPNVLHLSGLRLVPQTAAALTRHADNAKAAAAAAVDDLQVQQQRAQEKARQEREQQQQQQQEKARQARQQQPLNPQPQPAASGNAAPKGNAGPNGQPSASGNPAPGAPSGGGAPPPPPNPSQQQSPQNGQNGASGSPTLR